MSDESTSSSLVENVVPLSPQAASLARYAEFPVDYSTGVPDITIPLYEIKLGNFSLPVNISYHASGARVDDIPTSVGFGWTLNAGGAVTRTIFGVPDFQSSDTSGDFKYFKQSEILDLINNGKTSEIWNIAHNHIGYDTESDRYTFNIAGQCGIFRFNPEDRKFYILNRSDYEVDINRDTFYIYAPDNTIFTFSEKEATGFDTTGEGLPYTNAWYISEIDTHHGKIKFHYRRGHILRITKHSESLTGGQTLGFTADGHATIEPQISNNYSTATYVLQQCLVEKIEWNGNSITFEYTPMDNDDYTDRLVSMTVKNSSGDQIKKVNFGNDYIWPSKPVSSSIYPNNATANGRRLLQSLDDSENGIYQFSYKKDKLMPDYARINAPRWSDLYGYYRGEKNNSCYPRSVLEKIYRHTFSANGKSPSDSDCSERLPNEEATKSGILTEIHYPTGGRVKFNYELNSIGSDTLGGLRIASQTIYSSGSEMRTITYDYSNCTRAQEDPKELMTYPSGTLIYGVAIPFVYHEMLNAVSTPIFSAMQSSSPVRYMTVAQIENNGLKTVYSYDPYEELQGWGIADYGHPSTFGCATYDIGQRQALLVSKKIFDPDDNLLYEESRSYDKSVLKIFSPGMRTFGAQTNITYMGDAGIYVEDKPDFTWTYQSTFQYAQSFAYVRFNALKTETIRDITCGTSTTTEYTYDDQLRNVCPRTVSTVESDGTRHTIRYEYPFDFDDAVSSDMVAQGYLCTPVNISRYAGSQLLSSTRYEYSRFNGWRYYPVAKFTSTAGSPLVERERVTGYNSLGSPLGVISEQSDTITFSWNPRGNLLLSTTSPGGFRTDYTHRELCGIASITLPNGYRKDFSYNSASFLSAESDIIGPLASYSYSILNHSSPSMSGNGNSVTTMAMLDAQGSQVRTSRQYCDSFGRPTLLATGGANTSGTYLYSAVSYDIFGRETRRGLPVVGSDMIENLAPYELPALYLSTYSDPYAYSEVTYDHLNRVTSSTRPGEAWHTAGKKSTVSYFSNATDDVKLYSAPVDRISLVKGGYYPAGSLSAVKNTDEDGVTMTTFTDRSGRTILERRGSGEDTEDTYYVYNPLGQLRYVLSPQYQNAGYKDEYVYEYRYDDRGNIVKKYIPGCSYIQFWYDRAGRMTFMQDETLRSRGLYRFYLYDHAGRQCLQGVCVGCDRGQTVRPVHRSGSVGSGFHDTGYTIADGTSLIGVSLELATYYDDYNFIGSSLSSLSSSGASAIGNVTGMLNVASDGSRIASAIYYDIRGNMIEAREISPDGKIRRSTHSYTYSGDIESSSIVEPGLTVSLANSFDTASGLLTAADLTVNGVTQRISSNSYSSLGQLLSTSRGNEASAGTINYQYTLTGLVNSIAGPGFTQHLYYNDGPGSPCWNGSVSSFTWTMGTDTRLRGYRFSYDSQNRLRSAVYGENENLITNPNRYTEEILEFGPNSMPKRFQRHGLKADGVYGKTDNLHLSFSGNRISDVIDDARPVTTPGAMDFAGHSSRSYSLEYDSAGNLISDNSRAISLIDYDNSNRPLSVTFSNGNRTSYLYTATGEKLRMIHSTAVEDVVSFFAVGTEVQTASQIVESDTTDYRGDVIYRHGRPARFNFSGGYVDLDGTSPRFHYYTLDYLGSVRATVDGTTGALEQTIAYYPFGGIIADLGLNRTLQPYKFLGKELDQTHGLNQYDFGARHYYPALTIFTQPDPLSEKTPWLSPYLYCGANPVNLVDRDGRRITTVIDDVEYEYKEVKGRWGFYDSEGNRYDKQNYFFDALEKLRNLTSISEALICDLVESERKINLTYSWLNPDEKKQDKNGFYGSRDGGDIDVYWNLSSDGGAGRDKDGTITTYRDMVCGLTHELGHAYDYIYFPKSVTYKFYSYHLDMDFFKREEIIPCIFENDVRVALGDPVRICYGTYSGGDSEIIHPSTMLNYSIFDNIQLESYLKKTYKSKK